MGGHSEEGLTGIAYRQRNQPIPDEGKRQRPTRRYVRGPGKLGVAVHSLRPESATHYQSSAAGTRTQSFYKEVLSSDL